MWATIDCADVDLHGPRFIGWLWGAHPDLDEHGYQTVDVVPDLSFKATGIVSFRFGAVYQV